MVDLETVSQSGQDIENVADDESSSKSGDEEICVQEEEDLEYLSNEGQVSTCNRSNFENGDIPQCSMSIQLEDPSSTLGSPTTMLSPLMPSPIPLPASFIPCIDASAENQFTVNAPETQAGKKHKTHDLHSMLAVCTCGQAVSESEILHNWDIIMCCHGGCEMGWVSQILIQEKSKTY